MTRRRPLFDSSLALRAEPHDFISGECARLGRDAFETRLLLCRAVCMSGVEAAALFGDADRIEPISRSSSDWDPQARAAMLQPLVEPPQLRHLARLAEEGWQRSAAAWSARPQVVLYDELKVLLTRVVCEWAGVPLAEGEPLRRSRQLAALFEGTASLGIGRLKAWDARRRLMRWLGRLVEQVRTRRFRVAYHSALRAVAEHHGPDGRLLQAKRAAAELIELMRPALTAALDIVFAAHALKAHPECLQRLADAADPGYADRFVQEVRRCYPVTAPLAGRARRDFEWHGCRFRRHMRVLLDLAGSHHPPRQWAAPDDFRPERFRDAPPRLPCWPHDPGAAIGAELTRASAVFLARRLEWETPPQSLAIDRRRRPALPRDRFVVRRVRLR
jgi:fatty-acid peroxygenase